VSGLFPASELGANSARYNHQNLMVDSSYLVHHPLTLINLTNLYLAELTLKLIPNA